MAEQTVITISPPQLDLVGMQGSVISRSLFVTTPHPIERVQLIPPNLNRSDRSEIFPPQAVQIPGTLLEDSKNGCQASTIQKIAAFSEEYEEYYEAIFPICFDLKNVSSGKFSSQLQISYQGGQQLIPITVKVKAYWLLPLTVLLVGSSMGIAVSVYRSQGKPRDEILVRVGRLRAEMQEDTELIKAPSFHTQIEAHLYDVKVGLQGDKLETAENGIEQAEQVWTKWVKGRTDWLNQLAYWEELNQRLQDLNPNIFYVQILRREMEETSREISWLKGPDKLRHRLNELAEQLNKFLQVQALDKQLRDWLGQLPSEEKPNWELKILDWERKMNRIQPSELMRDGTLITEMEETIAQMRQLSTNPSGATKGILSIPHLAPAPSARPLSWEQEVSGAGVRLRWFTWASYAIALMFLTGAGFNQLYVNDSTFGANPWQDYFALLTWGFGAEATRDSITKMIQR